MPPSEASGPASVTAGRGVVRLGELIGLEVVGADGRRLGWVNDARLAPGRAVPGVMAERVVEGLVVGDRHAGSFLGYDRRSEQGPVLVRAIVRWLHRKAGYVPWTEVRTIDMTAKRVEVRVTDLEPLAETG